MPSRQFIPWQTALLRRGLLTLFCGAVLLLALLRRGLLTLFCGAVLLLPGCQEEGIRHYQVPKPESTRLLAALVPHGDQTWFVKLMGPASAVEPHAAAFEQFVRSLRFTGQVAQPVAWTVPDGWQAQAGPAERHATFRLGPQSTGLEVTVTSLGKEAAAVLPNVNRWRGQIGLAPLADADLGSVTRTLKLNGDVVTLVDLTGPGSKKGPLAMGGPPPARRPVTYQVPLGWEENARPEPMHTAAFRVREGGQTAEITLTPLPGPAGGLLGNVNRWREQVQLSSISEEELRKDLKPLELGGLPGHYVDLLGPESAGARRQRILGVVATRGTTTWFVKMRGPADLVGKQKTAFEAFVGSIRFDASAGANDG
jgi:hypothetical protein